MGHSSWNEDHIARSSVVLYVIRRPVMPESKGCNTLVSYENLSRNMMALSIDRWASLSSQTCPHYMRVVSQAHAHLVAVTVVVVEVKPEFTI